MTIKRTAVLRGCPVVVLMFYGTGQHVCSILIDDVQQLDAGLSEEASADREYPERLN
jgi:hypothetical protein